MKLFANFQKWQAGTTLIELIVYMSFFALFTAVLLNFFVSVLNIQLESESSSSVWQDGQFITERLIYDIQRAQNIVTPSGLGDSGSSLQITVNGIQYSYSVNGGNLELTNNQGTDRLNSVDTSVSNLLVRKIGNVSGKATARVSFTLTSIVVQKGGPEVRNFQTTVSTR